MSMKKNRAIMFYLFISPWFLIFITLGLVPLLTGLYFSFTNYTGFNYDHLRFVGLNNFKNVFTDNDAMYALGRTMLITIIYVPISTIIGLLLAILLNNKLRGTSLYRTAFYLPSVVPVVAAAFMWKNIFAKESGMLNSLLNLLQIKSVDWLGYDHASLSLMIMLLWGVGGGLLINLAGLKGISSEIYEAASIDGISPVSRLLYITLPLMTPVIFYNVVMGLIGMVQIYTQPVLLSGGNLLDAPIRPNYVYAVHAFQQIFAYQRFGYGLALLWILFLAILLLTLALFGSSRFWVHYEVDQEGK